ncbi:hypothetical protein [Streptomyces sp. NPDC005209]|uniref:hypothetical protein n=1 Tax=Streptomyces sp. NPDC005209 TaxID=3156715 RepID=UPI0033B8EC27
MRTRQGLALALTVIVIAMALTGACAEQKNQEGKAEPGNTASSSPGTTTPAPSWDGKEGQEDAMRRATLHGTGRPSLHLRCRLPGTRPPLGDADLARGDARSEWEVTCGDREADQFNIAAGGPFTVRITHAGQDAEGLVLWRLNTVAPQDVDGCEDDIKGCEG